MTAPAEGLVAGRVFGSLAVALMLPMSFPDKRTALLAAFLDRFGIGVAIGCATLPHTGWLIGLGFGLLLSAPSALITKAYLPILVVGGLGGTVIGGLIHGWS